MGEAHEWALRTTEAVLPKLLREKPRHSDSQNSISLSIQVSENRGSGLRRKMRIGGGGCLFILLLEKKKRQ